MPEDELVPALPLQVAALGKVREDPASCLEPVKTGVPRATLVDRRVIAHHVDRGEAVTLADLEVGRVVGRRDLDSAGAEGPVDRLVGDDRHVPVHERDADPPADEGRVALVVGVHRDARVAEDRLGPRRRDGDRRVGQGQAG